MEPPSAAPQEEPPPPLKKDPLDFVLWQSPAPGEPVWPSPWGNGRPGRHIEGPATVVKFLGARVDIIGGGRNHILPHHEYFLAQMECLAGERFAPLWIHSGEANLPGSGTTEKITLEKFRHLDGAALRLAFLDRHRGAAWNFDHRDLRMAVETAQILRQALRRKEGRGARIDSSAWERQFNAAMEADLDTPGALKILRRTAVEIMQNGGRSAGQAQAFLARALRVLGIAPEPL